MPKFSQAHQLKDVTIVIADVDYTDDGDAYATTRVYRYDLEGDLEAFVRHVESSAQIVEGGQVKNE